MKIKTRRNIPFIAVLLLVLGSRSSYSAEYSLAVQPLLPPDKMEKIYTPLADYLSKKTGQTIKLSTFRSFTSYWSNMKRLKGFDMVLDGAHFTDYRVKKNQYKVLAKVPDTVSFTVVTRGDLFVFDVTELSSYRVATMIAPSMGGLLLMEMFPDTDKQPNIISSIDVDDCIKQIVDGHADAAIIPTPMVGNYENLNVVVTTNPMPHEAFSVSPDIPQNVANSVRDALIEASSTDKGREMLTTANLPPFSTASEKTYDGYAKIMQVMTKR